jgi:hypothetical protein
MLLQTNLPDARDASMKTLLIVSLLFLTSCVDYQARMAAQQAAEAQAAADYERGLAEQKKAQNDADDAQCKSYGVKPGSQPYVACRMNLANNRQAAEIAQAQAASAEAIAAADRRQRAIAAMNQPAPVVVAPGGTMAPAVPNNGTLMDAYWRAYNNAQCSTGRC